MGLFDALSGRIQHFNNTAVPVHNSIFSRIGELPNEKEEQLFAQALVIAQLGIDLFFKPGQGPAIKDIKKYNKHNFEQLYALFMIWVFYDLANFGAIQHSDIKGKTESLLVLTENELSHYLEKLKHGTKIPIGLEKLWDEIVKILHTMPNTPENYFVFAREFSRICRATYQQIN